MELKSIRHEGALGSAAALATARHGKELIMLWTTPTLVEICIGLEINGYLPAEF